MGCLLTDWGASMGPCIWQAGPTTSEQRPPRERGALGVHTALSLLGTHSAGLLQGLQGARRGGGLSGWRWLPAPPLPQAEASAGCEPCLGV